MCYRENGNRVPFREQLCATGRTATVCLFEEQPCVIGRVKINELWLIIMISNISLLNHECELKEVAHFFLLIITVIVTYL